MGSYFTKPEVKVSLGGQERETRLFKTFGEFRSWAHKNFRLQGKAKDYSICHYGIRPTSTSHAHVEYSALSHFDNPTRLWLKAPGITYHFFLTYMINSQ